MQNNLNQSESSRFDETSSELAIWNYIPSSEPSTEWFVNIGGLLILAIIIISSMWQVNHSKSFPIEVSLEILSTGYLASFHRVLEHHKK